MKSISKKISLIIIITCMFTTACAINTKKDSKILVCRHWAIMNAVAYTDFTGFDSRIILGNPIVYGNVLRFKWHAQAQGIDKNGIWHYLTMFNGKVLFGEQEDFIPKYHINTLDYINKLYLK